ncbi:DUF3857 domain-containing protein [Mucilaginibacter hurinus]|nr:DUF3857 domain-containing protein [Mucilaginibacter hurinus]
MKKLYLSLVFCAFLLYSKAQSLSVNTQPFGKIDEADLTLKNCDFETDANAMVLFDKADVYFDQNFNIINERHKRIKIFNDKGKKHADIRIQYNTYNRLEYITGLQAQTINLADGKVEIIKIDKKQVFTESVDKWRSALVFTFPNVKPGSVIEFKYKWTSNYFGNFPGWYFQEKIPCATAKSERKCLNFFTISQVYISHKSLLRTTGKLNRKV